MAGEQLSNADFRKLLATPRPGGNTKQADTSKDAKPKKSKANKPFRPKPKSIDEAEEKEGDGNVYRDRAAERRQGETADQDTYPDVTGGFFIPSQAMPARNLTVEETKYLGGDIDHTHLVKGLDYALLNKVRSEQEPEKGSNAASDKHVAASLAGVSAPDSGLTIKSRVARGVYDALFGPKIENSSVSELFLPKRTAFLYELDGPFASDVPTTLRRAKEDCPKPKELMYASTDGAVLERLVKIVAYMSMAAGGKRKIKKKDKAELLSALDNEQAPQQQQQMEEIETVPEGKPVDDDEDIFADAGTDFVIERRKPAEEPAEGPSKKVYFGNASELEVEEHAVVLPKIAVSKKSEEARWAEEKEKLIEKAEEAQNVDDGYGECFPAYFDTAGTVYDSEDEDGKKKPVAPEEEEETAEGKGKKDSLKEAIKAQVKEKNKIANELKEIEKVFDEKGYDKTGFGKKSKAPAEDAAPAVPQKKRRI